MKPLALKAFFVAFIFCIPFSNSNAQEPTRKVSIVEGEESTPEGRSTISGIVGRDETGIYVLRTTTKSMLNSYYSLDHYNREMDRTHSVKIDQGSGKKRVNFEWVGQIGDNVYLFTNYLIRKEKRRVLYAQKIDRGSLLPKGERKEVSSIPITSKIMSNRGGFFFEYSQDSSHIAIFQSHPYQKGVPERVIYSVFNDRFEKVFDKDVELPFEEEKFSIQNYLLTNNGELNLIGAEYPERRTSKQLRREGKPNFFYKVVTIPKRGGITTFDVNLPDKFITDLKVLPKGDNRLVGAGFYSDQGTWSIKGTFFMLMNLKTKEVEKISKKEFSLDFITANFSEKAVKKTEKKAKKGKQIEMYEYDLDHLIIRPDGSTVLIGEQYYIRVVTTTRTTPNGGTTTTSTYHYYYNDIIVVNIDARGDIAWMEKIPKRQHSINDGGYFSSYALMQTPERLYFVFNDNPKNLRPNDEGKYYNFKLGKESTVVLVSMENNGRYVKEAIFPPGISSVHTRPKVCEQMDGQRFVMFRERGKKEQFCELKFRK